MAFTSRWSVFEADALRAHQANRRPLLEEQRIHRGTIRAADRSVLARSVPGPAGTFTRRYPTGALFGHPLGYSFTRFGRSGLERARNDELTGRREELLSILDQLSGREREGNSVITALDPAAQRAASAALGSQRGAVVAIEPSTGRVRAMVSSPGLDPTGVAALVGAGGSREGEAALLNRATQGGYLPGSTFKVITASAAIDSGRFTPGSAIDGSSPARISGVPLRNFGDRSFGQIDLTTALTNSVNTVWARVGETLGRETLARYMRRFGFYERPGIDLPREQRLISALYEHGESLDPESAAIDVGRVAIGQERLRVTPLQMAMVAATIANGGVLMEPRITTRIVDPDGRVIERPEPRRVRRVMRRSTALAVTEMMRNVVREGTGVAAALAGVDVAGKTGTAEIVVGEVNQPWFIGFAPAERPRVAIAVTVERSTGQGGTVAAPIAARVLEALLRSPF